MADQTAIEWADSTFNPVMGCTAVSPACDHCYAEAWAKRSGLVKWGNAPRRLASDEHWKKPLRWQREASAFYQQHGRRRRVFCASLADVFDNQWEPAWRERLWSLILITPDIDWLLLTKRPQNITKMLPAHWGDGWSNVWLGTTVENQMEADRRIMHLCAAPAVLRFLSCEPLLGQLDLERVLFRCNYYESGAAHYVDVLRGGYWSPKPFFRSIKPGEPKKWFTNHSDLGRIGWIIAGGESGPNARPTHPDWLRALRDQCRGHHDDRPLVPFFFKQWGEWSPFGLGTRHQAHALAVDGTLYKLTDLAYPNGPRRAEAIRADHDRTGLTAIYRVGKKAAGRELDDAIHNEFPQLRKAA